MAADFKNLSKTEAVDALDAKETQLAKLRRATSARLKAAAGTPAGRVAMAAGAGAGTALVHRYTSAQIGDYKVPWSIPAGLAARFGTNDPNMHALGDDLIAAGTAIFIYENADQLMNAAGM